MRTPEFLKSPTVIVLLLTLISSWWFGLFTTIPSRWDAVPTYDAVFFIKLAENIARYQELGWIAYHEPFFYPLLIALVSLCTGDLFFSAVIISKVSAVLLPAAVYLSARSLFTMRVGLCAAFLTLFFPHIRTISGSAQSEALYVLLITCSVALLWKAWRQQSVLSGVYAGLLFSAAYLTRSEALFILLFQVAFLGIFCRKVGENRNFVRAGGSVLIAFSIVCAPYVGYLTAHYGSVTVGTKTSGIYFWVRDKCFHDPDPERTEWGLSPGGELNLISMKSSDLMAYWRKDLPRSVKVYFENFVSQLPGRIPNDGAIQHYPQVFPLYLAVPFLAGLVLQYRRREAFSSVGYLLSAFLLLFIYPLLTGGWWRYLVNLLPFFLILAAKSFDTLSAEYLSENKARGLLVIAVTVVSLYHVWIVSWQPPPQKVVTYTNEKASVSEEIKKAGAWVRSMIPTDATYMAQWTRLPYYLQGRWIAMPDADFGDVLRYAIRNRTEYMLIESGDAGGVARLANAGIPGISCVGTYSSAVVNYNCTLLRLSR